MQRGSGYKPAQQGTLRKPVLFGVISAVVVGIAAPLIMPHISHPSMMYHIILQIASLAIAVFLSVVSLLAYARNTGIRLLFMMLGFMTLVAVELLYLLDASAIAGVFVVSALNMELPHVILLIMLVMFALGVLKVNK